MATGTLVPHEGDVLDYVSDRPNRHCREQIAVVSRVGGELVAVDTFWATGGLEAHILTPDEIATATLRFTLGSVRELDPGESFEDFAPEVRRTITSQHGLRVRRFVLKGARPDRDAIIANAQDRVDKALLRVDQAQRDLEWAERDLADLQND